MVWARGIAAVVGRYLLGRIRHFLSEQRSGHNNSSWKLQRDQQLSGRSVDTRHRRLCEALPRHGWLVRRLLGAAYLPSSPVDQRAGCEGPRAARGLGRIASRPVAMRTRRRRRDSRVPACVRAHATRALISVNVYISQCCSGLNLGTAAVLKTRRIDGGLKLE
jgi:hypothetical protein